MAVGWPGCSEPPYWLSRVYHSFASISQALQQQTMGRSGQAEPGPWQLFPQSRWSSLTSLLLWAVQCDRLAQSLSKHTNPRDTSSIIPVFLSGSQEVSISVWDWKHSTGLTSATSARGRVCTLAVPWEGGGEWGCACRHLPRNQQWLTTSVVFPYSCCEFSLLSPILRLLLRFSAHKLTACSCKQEASPAYSSHLLGGLHPAHGHALFPRGEMRPGLHPDPVHLGPGPWWSHLKKYKRDAPCSPWLRAAAWSPQCPAAQGMHQPSGPAQLGQS